MKTNGLAQEVSSKQARFETAPEKKGPPQRGGGEAITRRHPTARPEEPPSSGGVSKGTR